jgi:general secretion pathway protein K
LIALLATEVSFDATAEYLIANDEVKKVQAYYCAKAGVQVSLLRINIYQQVIQQFGKQLGGGAQMLEMVWRMPFAWPPIIPDEVSRVDKDLIDKTISESLMECQYRTDIYSETSKIDLNDLVSPSKSLSETTKKQLIRLLENRFAAEDDFARENRDLKPEEIVNNIIDWMDSDSEGLNGADEKSYYAEMESDSIPPNQPLKTLDELHMIHGISDGIFDYLSPQVTVYGIKGVQVNYASEDILRSIDPQITEEVAKEIKKRRDDPQLGGIFKDDNDFLGFLNGKGVDTNRFNETKIPLIFDAEYNFRIRAIGLAGSSSRPTTREIIAIAYDFDKVKQRLGEIIAKDKAEQNPGASPTPTPVPGASPTPSPAPGQRSSPSIVYWQEL